MTEIEVQVPDCHRLVGALLGCVRTAGEAIMAIHGDEVGLRAKPDGSPVTLADEAAEKILLAGLADVAPDIPVISEENADSHKRAPPDLFFLVDPLDGTREFLRADGSGAFTVNIGLILHGAPIMGLIFAPAHNRMFTGIVGANGGAAEWDGDSARSIAVREIPESGALAVASRSHRDDATNNWLDARHITQTVAIGSSLKFCLLASGEADVYPRFGPTMEWDTAAGDAILRAAGGRVEVPDGGDYPYGKPGYRNGPFIAYGAAF